MKSDMKSTWKVLNEVINKKKSKPTISPLFKTNDNDNEISDPILIANKFCNYFTNIGPNLAKKIKPSQSHRLFLSGCYSQSVFLDSVTSAEIVEIAKSFQPNKSAGYDKIPMSIIKQFINIIAEPLSHILNLSIASGIVPDDMKIACVIPLFKAGDRAIFSNYRPVSILPCFSKFLERAMYNRLLAYLDKFKILYDNQYGFRKNHSTSLALIDLYDKISDAIDRKETSVGIFLDLSKAFDTVNHEILFDKLEHYGIRGLPLQWIKSYFTNRTQFVQFNEHRSSPSAVCCGVPQGSILGPLFFLLYINDICNVSQLVETILFADDTNIFFSHKDPQYVIDSLNNELEKLSDWFQANKLSLNTEKTKFMVFKPRQKKFYLDIKLFINNKCIEQVKETVFLGVILDENLSWKSHFSHIANKISKSIGIIYKASFCLPLESLRTLYYSIIYPYLQYCVIVWGLTYPTNIRRIELLQKRIIRILNKSAFDAHTSPIFKKLGLLKLNDICMLQLGQFMFHHKFSLLPERFDNMFLKNDQTHTFNTRNSSKYHVPSCRTNIRQFSVRFQGPKFFNSLSRDLVDIVSSILFKKKLKQYLCSMY